MRNKFLSVIISLVLILSLSVCGSVCFADEYDSDGWTEEEVDYEAIISGVENTTIKATSEVVKDGIKISWTKQKGYAVDYYEIYRSTKKDSGYGTEPYYTTKSGTTKSYTDKKNQKKGKTYYYKVKGVREIDGIKYYTKASNKVYRKAPKTSPVPVESGDIIVKCDDSFAKTVSVNIHTSSGKNYYVYFDSLEDKGKDSSIYIKGGVDETIYLPGGRYTLYYCYGSTWYGKDTKFGSATVGAKGEGTITLDTFGSYDLTLYAVTQGNLSTRRVSMDNFPS